MVPTFENLPRYVAMNEITAETGVVTPAPSHVDDARCEVCTPGTFLFHCRPEVLNEESEERQEYSEPDKQLTYADQINMKVELRVNSRLREYYADETLRLSTLIALILMLSNLAFNAERSYRELAGVNPCECVQDING